MLSTEELKQVYADMKAWRTAPFLNGRYRLNVNGSKYWLSEDGSLELISQHTPKKSKHNWIMFN